MKTEYKQILMRSPVVIGKLSDGQVPTVLHGSCQLRMILFEFEYILLIHLGALCKKDLVATCIVPRDISESTLA